MRELEVLVGELVTVDGLSETEASAIGLPDVKDFASPFHQCRCGLVMRISSTHF